MLEVLDPYFGVFDVDDPSAGAHPFCNLTSGSHYQVWDAEGTPVTTLLPLADAVWVANALNKAADEPIIPSEA